MSRSESVSVPGMLRAALLALAALAALPAGAEQRQYGQYEVLYSLFASDFLQPEVAAALGIVRAKDRAVLNVSVRRREPGAVQDRSVAARVTGTRSDLVHRTALEFRPVNEPGASYYLAEFPFRDGETVYFELAIEPEEAGRPLELRFDKTLYVD